MTYRAQRRGQVFSLVFIGLGLAMMWVPTVGHDPWKLFILAGGWELILWATSMHRCWSEDVNLDALVPLDEQGRPLE